MTNDVRRVQAARRRNASNIGRSGYRGPHRGTSSNNGRPYRNKRRRGLRPGCLMMLIFMVFIVGIVGFAAVKLAGGAINMGSEAGPAASKKVQETSPDENLSGYVDQNFIESNPNMVYSNGRYVDTSKPMIALTFDDGPEAKVGNVIMDELDKVGGRGTFFIVGNRVPEFETEVKRMAAEGHEIANHSYDHNIKISKAGVDEIRTNFQKTNDIVAELTGITPTLIRLPGGIESENVKQALSLPLISWSIDTLDWKTKNAQSTIDSIIGHTRDGDIVLMHELYTATAEACKTVIPELAAEGYQLVTVSELINFKHADVSAKKQFTQFWPKETTAESTEAAGETVAAEAEATASADEGEYASEAA